MHRFWMSIGCSKCLLWCAAEMPHWLGDVCGTQQGKAVPSIQRGQLLRLSNEWRHSAFQSRGVSPLVPGEWTPCRVFHLESGLLEFRRTLTKHTGVRKTEQENTDRVFLSGMGWFVFYALLIKSYCAWKILGCLFCFIIMCPWRCNCKPPGSNSYHRS